MARCTCGFEPPEEASYCPQCGLSVEYPPTFGGTPPTTDPVPAVAPSQHEPLPLFTGGPAGRRPSRRSKQATALRPHILVAAVLLLVVVAGASVAGFALGSSGRTAATTHPPRVRPTTSTPPAHSPARNAHPAPASTSLSHVHTAARERRFLAQLASQMSVSDEIRVQLQRAFDRFTDHTCSGYPSAMEASLAEVVRERRGLVASLVPIRAPSVGTKKLLAAFSLLETAKLQTDLAYQAWANEVGARSRSGGCRQGGAEALAQWGAAQSAEGAVKAPLVTYVAEYDGLASKFGMTTWSTLQI